MKPLAFASALFVGVTLVAGCGGGGSAQPATAQVGGTVTLDGKPLSDGEVRFAAAAQPVQVLPVKDGSFSGQVYTGKNQVEVVAEKDGPPHPMDPNVKLKVNVVSNKFTGPNSTLSADIPAGGKTDMKFEVTSARR